MSAEKVLVVTGPTASGKSALALALAEWRKGAVQARRAGQLVLLVQRGFAAERITFDVD